MNLGWTEMLLLAGIALLVFGPTRLPGLGKSLGEAIRGFKKGLSEDSPSENERPVQNQQISNNPSHSQQLPHDSQTSSSGEKTTSSEKQRPS